MEASESSYDACFFGLFRSPKGIGEAARAKLAAARHAGLAVGAVNLYGYDDRLEFPGLEPAEVSLAAPKQVVFLNAVNFLNFPHGMPAAWRRGPWVIGEWYWELSVFPDKWLKAFDHADEIWAASRFVRDAIAAKTTKPVSLLPPMIEVKAAARDQARHALGLPAEATIFLMTLDFGSYWARKNADAGVGFFIDAFGSRSPGAADVMLVVKTHSSNYSDSGIRFLNEAAAENSHIRVIDQDFTRAEMDLLQSACDVFLSPHRSEGFGLNIAECMARGKPVIATNYSGNAGFMTEANSFPSPWKLVAVRQDEYLEGDGQVWAEPDRDYFVETMRRLHVDPALRAKVGQRAKADIERQFSRQAIGELLRRNLRGG